MYLLLDAAPAFILIAGLGIILVVSIAVAVITLAIVFTVKAVKKNKAAKAETADK